ncbi:MAG TPA: response regulator transcription factor [Anaerolineae bacterium]|nr:response regulator transcription factor [Anaerolineae bacterium]
MSLRILLVEKDVTTADLLVPSLERKGYQVLVSRSQRQALSRVRATPPDLLVVDVASFGNSGYGVCSAVRGQLPGVPTVILVDKAHAGVLAMADAYMTPPFTSRKLLYRVKALADKLTRRELTAGSLTLDPDTRVLRRDEQLIQLRPKEAALLALFMQNQGKVLNRPEIVRQVWETDYVGDTRTLSVHIRWLRQKIEADPSHPRFLRTVRGIGYRFEVPPSP